MKRIPMAADPRFASIFARCQAEVEQTQRTVTAQTLRKLCVVSPREGYVRPATDAEIAVEGAFPEEKNAAHAVGFAYMRAHAKRLARRYGLLDKYAGVQRQTQETTAP